ncbi:MAG: methyltransferase domain-containing protein [Mariniblastus sp.]
MNQKRKIRTTDGQRYLNIGCGRRYHSEWVNLDLESNDPEVIRHDITSGVPFDESQFDAVYHSHVLEHLRPQQGIELITECFRVLKPGGVLRIVVPDLERIANLYLEKHQQAWSGDQESTIDYNWMKLELLDQMVRDSSGGRMGRYMASREIKNSDFVKSRVGDELLICQETDKPVRIKRNIIQRLAESTFDFRRRMVRRIVRWTLGRSAEIAFDEGMFRSQGEVHRWMYDRYSLRELCENAGLVNFKVCTASESQIEKYSTFELDSANSRVRKPDSIFVECQKPQVAATQRQAA